jgi:ubiquinone/menaquinone biosynthesis C-methylase UbiE
MKKDYALKLLQKTKLDYNLIAPEFSSKRSSLSNDIKYLQKFLRGNKVLDLGCGNGRLCELFEEEVDYLGVDTSEELLKIARQKYPNCEFQKSEFSKLLFPDDQFDSIFCLSVFHHIPSRQFRLDFLQEIHRVLKKDGRLILTVWNLLEQKEIRRQIIKNILFEGNLDYRDIYLPFSSQKEKLVDRYIHCFSLSELKRIVQKANFSIIESGELRRGKSGRYSNYYVVAKK